VVELQTRQQAFYNFTHRNAQVLNDLFDILESIYGEEAQLHFQRYVKLWPNYCRLKNNGVNVRFSPHRFGRRPLLIIDGGLTMSDSKKPDEQLSGSDRLEDAKAKALETGKLADEKLATELLEEKNREAVKELSRRKTP